MAETKKPWGGRFAAGTDKTVEAFTASIDFDRRLFREDIAGLRSDVRREGFRLERFAAFARNLFKKDGVAKTVSTSRSKKKGQ